MSQWRAGNRLTVFRHRGVSTMSNFAHGTGEKLRDAQAAPVNFSLKKVKQSAAAGSWHGRC